MLRKNAMTRWTATAILLAGVGLMASEAQAQLDILHADGFAGLGSGSIGHTNQGTLAEPEHSNQGGGSGDPDPGDPLEEMSYGPDTPIRIGGVRGGRIADAADLWFTLPIESDVLVQTTGPAFNNFDYRSAPVAVPEPASLMLIALGLGCLVRRRR